MKELVVISGKGGTGKTSIVGSFAALARNAVIADCDVDAADLHLILAPTVSRREDFSGGSLARVRPGYCTACGKCEELCRFDAVFFDGPGNGKHPKTFRIDPIACEGCAACFYQCPEEAIRMEEAQAGLWFRSDTRFGPLFHAHLFAAQENSGKLVTLVKQQARLLALDEGREMLIVDGPPGIGCPVIALMVVEPTVAGIHDLERVLATANHFGIPSLVVINKADINAARTEEITAFCEDEGVEVVGQIPYDDAVTEAVVGGQPVTVHGDGLASRALRSVWIETRRRLMGV